MVRYDPEMADTAFQRARTEENKRQRAMDLMDAARSLALEQGVASVTLTAIAERAGVHYSAMRRYFSSHKDVLLRLAAEGWVRWSDAVCAGLQAEPERSPATVAGVLTRTLAADPLFCDLLANVPLHLEHDVVLERVVEFKRTSHAAVVAMSEAIEAALPDLGAGGGLDVVSAANALAATLWQTAHPSKALAQAYAEDPGIAPVAMLEFVPTLTRLLTATCVGLSAQ